ncbi:MAG: hypothetical protein WAW80_01230 [Candidatus Saccharimonadales bacterium]
MEIPERFGGTPDANYGVPHVTYDDLLEKLIQFPDVAWKDFASKEPELARAIEQSGNNLSDEYKEHAVTAEYHKQHIIDTVVFYSRAIIGAYYREKQT